ncbi:MAG: hypothetical protein ACRC6V_09205 [Bacteroidales bacterium]
MFKIGDKVKVVRKATREEQHDWMEEMDLAVGKRGVVLKTSADFEYPTRMDCFLVEIDDVEYWYHQDCLALAQEEQCALKNELEQEINNLKREMEKKEDMLKCIELMNKHSIKITFVDNFKV